VKYTLLKTDHFLRRMYDKKKLKKWINIQKKLNLYYKCTIMKEPYPFAENRKSTKRQFSLVSHN